MRSIQFIALAITLSIGHLAFSEGLTAEDLKNGVSEFAPTEEVCFRENRIRNFEIIDRENVIVEIRKNERYNVNVFSCWELDYSNAIAFTSGPAGSSRICRGDKLLVVDHFPPHRVLDRCPIKSITRAQ